MNLLSKLLLASGLCAAMASDSANLRATGDEQLRQLSETDYSSSSSSSSSSSLSGGTYMWYLLLNGLNALPDAIKGDCEKKCGPSKHRELNTQKHHWWGGDDWADDGYDDDWHADGWEGDNWEGDEWKDDSHSSSSSSSSKKSGGGSKKKEECPPLPPRCKVPHVKKISLPKKKTSSKKKSSSTDDWHDDAWEGDEWHDDAWEGDDHAAAWDDDGHHWGDDGYYWDDDGHWGDDQWGDDGNSNKHSSWLKYNNNNQSSKSKLLWPLVGVGLLVGVLAAALVARRVS